MRLFSGKKKGILSEGYLWVLMALLMHGLGRLFETRGDLLEKFYPASANRTVIRFLSNLTGIFPLSLGEFFVYLNVTAGVFLLIILLKRIFTGGALTLAYRIISYAALLYVVFMLVFGFNYQRPSVRQYVHLEKTAYGYDELYAMNEMLIQRANALREKVSEDEKGVFVMNESREEIYAMAKEGYDALGADYPEFSGSYGVAKGIILSESLNYTGITGIFMPFTGEANVNTKGPDLLFPATVLHEMAHQRGVAYEDEANYMAYLSSLYHENETMRYSGTMLALISSMNALYREDRESYLRLYETYSDAVKRDLSAYNAFYKAYEGEVNDRATKVNDTYLKSNGQTSGVKSYGEMVNLLLEQYVQKGGV